VVFSPFHWHLSPLSKHWPILEEGTRCQYGLEVTAHGEPKFSIVLAHLTSSCAVLGFQIDTAGKKYSSLNQEKINPVLHTRLRLAAMQQTESPVHITH
jgi:hypothetical protein